MGPGDSWEDGRWQIINNHLSHRFPCSAAWQTTGYRQGAASSASRDAAAAAATHMWPQCSGADFLHSGSILLIHQWNKQKKKKKEEKKREKLCNCEDTGWVVICEKKEGKGTFAGKSRADKQRDEKGCHKQRERGMKQWKGKWKSKPGLYCYVCYLS